MNKQKNNNNWGPVEGGNPGLPLVRALQRALQGEGLGYN